MAAPVRPLGLEGHEVQAFQELAERTLACPIGRKTAVLLDDRPGEAAASHRAPRLGDFCPNQLYDGAEIDVRFAGGRGVRNGLRGDRSSRGVGP